MREQIKNPLFEKLISRARNYDIENSLYEQEKHADVEDARDVFAVETEIGLSIVNGFYKAVSTYLGTPYRDKYLATVPDKLQELATKAYNIANGKDSNSKKAQTGTSGTAGTAGTSGSKDSGWIGSNVIFQVEEVLKMVKSYLSEFSKGTSEDVKYQGPLLDAWKKDIASGINSYTAAHNGIKKEFEETAGTNNPEDKVKNAFSEGILKIKKDVEAAIEKEKQSKKGLEENNNTDILQKLINNSICVGFNDFNKIKLLESTKGDIRRAKKELSAEIKSALASIQTVIDKINQRASNDSYKDFESLKMSGEFILQQKDMIGFRDELDNESTPMGMDDLDHGKPFSTSVIRTHKIIDKLVKKFEDKWNEEFSRIGSVKVVAAMNPQILKDYNQGNDFFASLEIDIRNIAIDASNKKHQPAANEKDTDTVKKDGLKIKDTIKRAQVKGKNSEVESFQKLVIKAFSTDPKISAAKVYKELKAALDGGQGGNFGQRTERMVKFLKGGFKISDTSTDITQELIDKINSIKVNESLLFEQETEGFDFEAANKAIGSENVSNKVEKNEKKKSSKISKDALIAAKKETDNNKIIKNEEAKKIIGPVSMEFDASDAADDLKKFSDEIEVNDKYGESGQSAIATSPGIRFYANKTGLRLFDKKMGRYDLKNGTFKVPGEKDPDKLIDLIKNGVPKKYKYIIVKLRAVFTSIVEDEVSEWAKNSINWSDDEVRPLAVAYKTQFNESLGSALKNISPDDSNITAFRKKFNSLIN